MRKLSLVAAVLLVAAIAVPASASVQNVKISGAIDSTYVYRNDFDFGTTALDQTQSDFITQTTLNVDADLTDQVSATIGLINERAWTASIGADSTDIDVYLAYVTLREMLYSPLTVVIGKQAFAYGNSFIFDSAGANNVAPADSGIQNIADDFTKQTTLDAVRAILDYDPLTIEAFWAKADSGTTGSTDLQDDVDVYGVNATYDLGDDLDTQVEGYFFARFDKSSLDGATGLKTDKLYIPGLRASTNPLDGLNVSVEYAHQFGTASFDTTGTAVANRKRDADALQFMANFKVPVLEEYNPVASYSFTWLSGDNSQFATTDATQSIGDEDYQAWDPFFESQGGGTIYNTLFNLTNMQIHSVTLEAQPLEDVTTTLAWHGLWLDKAVLGSNSFSLLDPGSTTNTTTSNKSGHTGLGQEIDLMATYAYTEDVSIGANFGWFIPGGFFKNSLSKDTATQALVNVSVAF